MPISEKPIIFSSTMVRAILAGAKTQTRRIVKARLPLERTATIRAHGDDFLIERWSKCKREMMNFGRCDNIVCPYGKTGDRLWVRETFYCAAPHESDGYPVHFRADDDLIKEVSFTWKPSIFMPRWASRITLEIKDVRVERLQDISEEDAKAEGVGEYVKNFWMLYGRDAEDDEVAHTATESFASLWNPINGRKAAWSTNPFVWAVSFKRVVAKPDAEIK